MLDKIDFMIKISIILPIYKVEPFLPRCLDSLYRQDMSEDEYEVIAVIDGSPDRCEQIVRDYTRMHSNLKVLVQKNQGLSSSRNNGLQVAKGEYVWFVDSDDFIEENCLKTLCDKCINDNLDMMPFGIRFYHEEREPKFDDGQLKRSSNVVAGIDYLMEGYCYRQAWTVVFRRAFLLANNLRFADGYVHEDEEFMPRAYYLAKRVAYCPHPVYYYLIQQGHSISTTKGLNRAKGLIHAADSLYTFINIHEVNHNSAIYKFFRQRVSDCALQGINLADMQTALEVKKKPYYPLSIHKVWPLKRKLQYILANLSIRLYKIIKK